MDDKPKDGLYYATKTLLGGPPDVNRRIVYCWPGDRPVCIFNNEMSEWTPERERLLQTTLAALNASNSK